MSADVVIPLIIAEYQLEEVSPRVMAVPIFLPPRIARR
jgi:hypothetical protein